LAERVRDEGVAPEFEAGVAVFGLALKADAVDDGGVNAVGDGVRALNGDPRIELRLAKLGFLVRVPTDAGGIENDLCTVERGDAGAFRIPLVPANLHADASVARVEVRETEVAGREVKLFVIERIVRNVHLAIFAEEAAVGVKNGDTVVVHAGGATFKEGNDERDLAFLGHLREFLGRRTGNRFREIEEIRVFRAAKVFTVKKFVQADDLSAACRGFANPFDGMRKICVGVDRAFHLHDYNGKFVWHEIQFSMSANFLFFTASLYYQLARRNKPRAKRVARLALTERSHSV